MWVVAFKLELSSLKCSPESETILYQDIHPLLLLLPIPWMLNGSDSQLPLPISPCLGSLFRLWADLLWPRLIGRFCMYVSDMGRANACIWGPCTCFLPLAGLLLSARYGHPYSFMSSNVASSVNSLPRYSQMYIHCTANAIELGPLDAIVKDITCWWVRSLLRWLIARYNIK